MNTSSKKNLDKIYNLIDLVTRARNEDALSEEVFNDLCTQMRSAENTSTEYSRIHAAVLAEFTAHAKGTRGKQFTRTLVAMK